MSEKEAIRYAVRRHLYDRPTVSQDSRTVHRSVSRREICDHQDVAEALQFLEGLGQVKCSPDPMGGTFYYSITPQGTLAEERSE